MSGVRDMQPLIDRLLAKVDKRECWIWRGAVNSLGYGVLSVNGAMKYAHRVSYEVHIGAIPDGYNVCHRCDVPACVNPEHLFAATQKENIADKLRKGRANTSHGESHWIRRNPWQHPMQRMTPKQHEAIRAMRASGSRQVDLASQFGISQSSVSRILLGDK